MSLTASMWTGVSGLLAHGEKMNVIGNNIANVNTVGFKSQRMDFADFVYQNGFSTSGITQIGRGVNIGIVMGDFSQGPYESTNSATDLAINGRGFFKVNKIGTDQSFYSRAGDFYFNKEGYLINPSGFALQGWKVDNAGGVMQATGGMAVNTDKKNSPILGSGVPQDIKLDTWTVFPQQTTSMSFKVNLPKSGVDHSSDNNNPFASLINTWNGSQPPPTPGTKPIAEGAYAEQTTMEVFDEAGVKHKVTVYFDKVDSKNYTGMGSGYETWEYIVTMDPAEDQRMYADAAGVLHKVNETKAGGMLMSGTMTFDSGGAVVNQSSYTWGGAQNPTDNPTSFVDVPDPADPLGNDLKVITLDPTNLNNWHPAAISNSGMPIFVANFTGILDAQTPGSPKGSKYNIELDFGLRAGNFSAPWTNDTPLGALTVAPYVANNGYNPADPTKGPEFYRVNADYDPTRPKSDPYGVQYLLDVPGFTYYNPATGELDPAVVSNPAFIKAFNAQMSTLYGGVDLNMTAGQTFTTPGGVTYTVDTAFTITPGMTDAAINALFQGNVTPATFDIIATADDLEAFNALMSTAINTSTNRVSDRSVFAPATAADGNALATFNKPVVRDSMVSTHLNGPFSSNQAQNGYGYGDLTDYTVDQQGVLYGIYSNGVTLPLYQVTLYDFTCTQALRREGNNLYSKTRASGEEKSGPAGMSGLGSISGNTLEQSNVDMSREFVQMITTQRGFQSNSKIITTVDLMLDTVIQMKR